MVADKFGR